MANIGGYRGWHLCAEVTGRDASSISVKAWIHADSGYSCAWGARTMTVTCNGSTQTAGIDKMNNSGNADSNVVYFTFGGLASGTGYRINFSYDVRATLSGSYQGTWTGYLDSSTTTASYWNDINAYNPAKTAQNGLIFDLSTSDGGRWYNITNEPSDFTKAKGTTATISNIRSNVAGAHYSGNNVTNNAASSFTWTFNSANWVCELYTAWNTHTMTVRAGTGIADITSPAWSWTGNYKTGTVTYGQSFTVNVSLLTGYHWVNWTGSFTTSTQNYTFTIGDQNYDVTANGAPNTYTVAYNANGGEGSTASSSHTYNSAKNLTANGFTRSGFRFVKWNTKSDGTGTSYTNQQSVTNLTSTNGGTVTLYAIWEMIALPSTSASVDNILPKSFDLKSTTNGTISFVSTKFVSDKIKNLLTQYNMPVKVLSDGSVWIRLYYHDSKGASVLWNGTAAQAINNQEADRYSRLNLLGNDDFKINGKFELMLTYPTNTDTSYNRWRQTKAPQNEAMPKTSTGTTVTGYEAIHIDWSGSYWGGLELNGEADAPCYIDGSVGHGNWWFAIAPKTPYNGGVPGPSAQVFRQTEIWLRVPEATGRVINSTANTVIHIEDLDDESTYVICSRTRNDAGAAYSSIVTCNTPVDQAKIRIKKDGVWIKGKTYYKKDGAWVKAKKLYMKIDGKWVLNINYDPGERK